MASFSMLPAELKDMIWDMAAVSEPRVLRFHRKLYLNTYNEDYSYYEPKLTALDVLQVPGAMHISKAAQARFRKAGYCPLLIGAPEEGEGRQECNHWVNHNIDTLWMQDQVGQRLGCNPLELLFWSPGPNTNSQEQLIRSFAISHTFVQQSWDVPRFWGPAMLYNYFRFFPALEEFILVMPTDVGDKPHLEFKSEEEKAVRMKWLIKAFREQWEGVRRQESTFYHNLALTGPDAPRYQPLSRRIIKLKLMYWDPDNKVLVQEFVEDADGGGMVPAFLRLEMLRGQLVDEQTGEVLEPRPQHFTYEFEGFRANFGLPPPLPEPHPGGEYWDLAVQPEEFDIPNFYQPD